MRVLEFKVKGKVSQFPAVEEATKTAQFFRHKCIHHWIERPGVWQKELYRHSTALRAEFPLIKVLNFHAYQASVERADNSIARLYENCRQVLTGKKEYPRFQKDCRSVEYTTSGWKLSPTRKPITFTKKKEIGKPKIKGTWALNFYQLEPIKGMRRVCRADGYYYQFVIRVDSNKELPPTGKTVGLDVG